MRFLKNTNNGNRSAKRWTMILFVFIATVLNYVDRLAFNYLSADGHLRKLIPDDSFGYIASAFFVAYMIANSFAGFMIDKVGTRIGYSLSMAFWTTAVMLHAFARLPLHFGICRFLLGIGEAGNWPAGIKLAGEWFPPEERSTAIGLFNSGAAMGAIVAPPLIAFLGMHFGWQLTFIIIGALGYVWLAIFWFTYYTPEHSLKESRARIIPPLKLIRTRFVTWFTISKIFMDPVWYFITFWIARYLVDVHGWGLDKIGWFAMLPFIVSDIGNILGGLFTQFIIKKGVPVPRARKIAVSIFGGLLILSLGLAPVVIVSPTSALCILSLAGFGYAAYTANSMAFPGDVVPQSATASVWGLASVGAGLGGAAFQSITGLTVKHLSTSHNYAFAYHTIFFGYGMMALVALVIVIYVMGPLKKNEALHEYVLTPKKNPDNSYA